VTAVDEDDRASLGVKLLTDLRDAVFPGEQAVSTVEILHLLNAMEDAPWGDLDGRPLTARGLSRMLGEYVTGRGKRIRSRTIRIGGQPTKGYHVEDLADAWARYCPAPPGVGPQNSVTPVTTSLAPTLTSDGAVTAEGACNRNGAVSQAPATTAP
jgi:hypothetical protein